MPTSDGYPTRDELQAILDFKGSVHELTDYVDSIWWHDGFRVRDGRDSLTRKKVKKLELSTWGWSGNEEAVTVLERTFFWFFWWSKSERGGHYSFEVPMWAWDGKNPDMEIGGLPNAKLEDYMGETDER